MFTLFYGLWKFWFKKDEFFVLILGLDNAGKSTFLEQAKIQFNPKNRAVSLKSITTTVGLNIGKLQTDGVVINFWDLGGQRELQALWDKYYAEAHGIIYIIDSSDRDRVDESRAAFESMIKNPKLSQIPLLLVANKNDIPNSFSFSRIQEIFQPSMEVVGERDSYSISCSALNGNGVSESIGWITDCIRKNVDYRPPHNEEQ